MWHEIFEGSNFCEFCGFFNDLQKIYPAKINCEKKTLAKIYSPYLDY